jgi:sugar phosphate isomerase/epimerase
VDKFGHLGLSSYGVSWSIGMPGYPPPPAPLDHLGLLLFADEIGLKLVQIVDNLPLHALSTEQRAQVRDEANARGILIEVGTRGDLTALMAPYIELAAYFGSPILRVVPQAAAYIPTADDVIRLVRASLPAIKDHGLILAIENHEHFKAQTLADIIDAIDDPAVGICLDTVNSFGTLEMLDTIVPILAPYVVNLHLKEFTIRRMAHGLGFEVSGAPAGQGMLDVPTLLATLRAHGRQFNTIIETWMPPAASMAETAAIEQDWVRQGAAYLRTLIPN